MWQKPLRLAGVHTPLEQFDPRGIQIDALLCPEMLFDAFVMRPRVGMSDEVLVEALIRLHACRGDYGGEQESPLI